MKLWREREKEIWREKRTCVMDCVGWKESWNRNWALLFVHAEFREMGLLTSSINNQPCTKHPAPAPASFPYGNNPQATQYWLTAGVALRGKKKKKLLFLGRKKKRQSRRYLPNPHYRSVTGCSVPWFWETLPEAAKSERGLGPYFLQLIRNLLQGEMKQYPRGWR